MKNLKNCIFIFNFLILCGFLVTGCKGTDDPTDTETLKLTGVVLPQTISTTLNSEVTFTGKGYAEGDIIKLTSATDMSVSYSFTVANVTTTGVTINLGNNIVSGSYSVTVIRGNEKKNLGITTISIQTGLDVPDKAGTNVKGIVYCNGKGVQGVMVSDGVEITQTDVNGIYYLNSAKKNGYVFVSIPSNYEVPTKNKLPCFYQYLTSSASVIDRCDFELYQVDNTNYAVVLMADMHLANRNNDISQFKSGFYSEVTSYASQLKTAGTKVYGLTLGDMSWDAYWYENSYSLPNYVSEIDGTGFQVFNTMGNHDNDPMQAGDFNAEATFRKAVGPNYYSFNIGKVHYIVLDDVQYINTNVAVGTAIGNRDYTDVVSSEQMNWLAKDLALITDKSTPIVVAMHIQLNAASVNSSGVQVNSVSLNNGTALKSALNSFSNVQFFTGHTHLNYNVEISSNMYEHNVAAVCATWWWTGKSGYAGNQICKDGSPGGYGILDVNGTALKYTYKGIGYDRNQQFRTYDRNNIQITAAKYASNASSIYQGKVPEYAGEYATASSQNIVLINVFNYDSTCKLEVTENETPLTVTRVAKKDPLHIISYEMLRLDKGADPTDDFCSSISTHMFQVTASSASSTLSIKLTDRNGVVYTETMTRPKAFTYLMK